MSASFNAKEQTSVPAGDVPTSGINANTVVLGLFVLAVIYFLMPGGKKHKVPSGLNAGHGHGQHGAAPKAVAEDDDEDSWTAKLKSQDKKAAVFFGSQTGTAQEYALKWAKEARSKFGVSSLVLDPEQVEFNNLDRVPNNKAVVFVMASYGEGEPTDNAEAMMEFLLDEDVQFSHGGSRLDNLNYVIFGLGNTTYAKYNEVARKLDARLQELGANRIGGRGEGDEIVGSEKGYMEWKESMWSEFGDRLELEAGAGADIADFSITEIGRETDTNTYLGELSEHALKVSTGRAPARGIYDAKNPYPSPVTARELFVLDGERNCVHLEFDISGTNISYSAGDHIAIWPSNPDMAVERFLSVLGLADKRDVIVDVKALDPTLAAVPFPNPATYEAIFRNYLELSALASRQTLATLAQYAPTPEARAIMERWGSDPEVYDREVDKARLRPAEALQLATGNDPSNPKDATVWPIPLDRIISLLPRQKPRYYSISSSSKMYPTTVHVTAVVLKYQTPESKMHGDQPRWVYGMGSNFLQSVQENLRYGDLAGANTTIRLEGMPTQTPTYRLKGPRDAHVEGNVLRVPIHIRRSTFRLPANTKVPVIMIGPGTGVAPFRGFVQERVAMARSAKQRKGDMALADWGDMFLFYGCRREDEDFLYRDEWPQYASELDGKLKIHTAFSRGPERKPDGSKIYVQDLIWNAREALVPAILHHGAFIYICGDAKSMAKEVERCLAQMLADYRGGTLEAEGYEELKSLKDKKRFQTDVWS
ncbi:hypothetical protein CspHIS471_0609620 [Cutaneotrichosporon sp. HIS471]|nr:hypothetical protein CspHIS471_0609620 [Cutaneotrichosporon sp. HIS471]